MKTVVIRMSISLAGFIASGFSHAALYQVVEVSSPTEVNESYGIRIEPESDAVDCFDTSCTADSYELAGETLEGTEGYSYKQEVPFDFDNGFVYLDYDDLSSYCSSELGYDTCDYWAYLHWYGNTSSGIGGLQNEREAYYQASYQSNGTVFFADTTRTFTPDPGSSAPSTDDYTYLYVDGSDEKVVNQIDESSNLIGNTSSGYYNYGGNYIRLYRSRGFYQSDSEELILEPEADSSLTLADSSEEQNVVAQMGQTMAFDAFTYQDATYVVGSAAVAPFYYDDDDKDYDSVNTSDSTAEDVGNCIDYDEPALYPECQNFAFASRAFIWNVTDSAGPNTDDNRFAVVDWQTGSTYTEYNDDEVSAQASVRAAAIAEDGDYTDLPVLVGYNTYIDDSDNFLMQAAVFRPSDTSEFTVAENAWETTFISNATVEVSDAYIHSNSLATGINQNMLVIGYAKRDADYPYDGVTNQRMFIADANDDTPSASFFSAHGETIFFDSAGGTPNAINNYNEIVGSVDAENHIEVGADQRAKRGFIYPLDDTGTDDTRRARFNNRAWWLDDLTNGGDYSSANNHFRIIDAGDINDAGVIAATAVRCYADTSATSSMEYDSTDHFAYCNLGVGDERVVAVQLIPIEGTDSSDISAREEDTTTVTRSGAGIGWVVLVLLAFLGLLRPVWSRR